MLKLFLFLKENVFFFVSCYACKKIATHASEEEVFVSLSVSAYFGTKSTWI